MSAPLVGATATLVFGGRKAADTPRVVVEVAPNGRWLIAGVVGGRVDLRERYTLRKNGHYAAAGRGQWDEYLRFPATRMR